MIAARLTPVSIAYDGHENRLCLVWDDLVEWQPGMREANEFPARPHSTAPATGLWTWRHGQVTNWL